MECFFHNEISKIDWYVKHLKNFLRARERLWEQVDALAPNREFPPAVCINSSINYANARVRRSTRNKKLRPEAFETNLWHWICWFSVLLSSLPLSARKRDKSQHRGQFRLIMKLFVISDNGTSMFEGNWIEQSEKSRCSTGNSLMSCESASLRFWHDLNLSEIGFRRSGKVHSKGSLRVI